MDKINIIENECIGRSITECENRLKKHFSVKFVDEKIDDGNNDGSYCMMRSYDVDEYYVRLYYNDNNGIVSDVSVIKQ